MPLIHPEHLDQLAVREMPEPKILISDLNVYYGNFHALKNVSLPIPKGCVTAFIGPSGCGQIDASAEFEPYAGSVSGAASRRLHPHG